MEQIVDFPDPADYNYPDELRLPDGTLLMGQTPEDSPLIMNRMNWRLYFTGEVLDENIPPVIKSTQNGVIYRLPNDSITISVLGLLQEKPGLTPEEVVSTILAWVQSEGVDLSNDDRFFGWALYVYDTISLLAIHGLIKIEK